MTGRDIVRLMLPAGVLVAAVLVIYALTYWDKPVERAAKRMTEVTVALQPITAAGPADAVSPILASIAARNGYERVWIVDGSETIAYSSRETEAGTLLEGPWRDFLAAATSPHLFRTTEWGDRLMLFSAHRSAATGRWSAVLEDGTPIRRERWAHLALMTTFAILALTLIGFAMQVAVDRGLLHPMTVLSEHVDGIATGKAAPTAAIERIAGQGGEPFEKIADALRILWTERDSLRRDFNERHALYLASTFLTGEMIMVATFEGRIAEVNRRFCERLGLDRSRILGRPLASLEEVLPAGALLEMGERSAREKRPFERLLFTFSPPERTSMDVVAAVQAVPFAGEPAFILVAAERRLGDDAAPEVPEADGDRHAEAPSAPADDAGGAADDAEGAAEITVTVAKDFAGKSDASKSGKKEDEPEREDGGDVDAIGGGETVRN